MKCCILFSASRHTILTSRRSLKLLFCFHVCLGVFKTQFFFSLQSFEFGQTLVYKNVGNRIWRTGHFEPPQSNHHSSQEHQMPVVARHRWSPPTTKNRRRRRREAPRRPAALLPSPPCPSVSPRTRTPPGPLAHLLPLQVSPPRGRTPAAPHGIGRHCAPGPQLVDVPRVVAAPSRRLALVTPRRPSSGALPSSSSPAALIRPPSSSTWPAA